MKVPLEENQKDKQNEETSNTAIFYRDCGSQEEAKAKDVKRQLVSIRIH